MQFGYDFAIETLKREVDTMTVARSKLVDVFVTPWYHVLSKVVRGAFLLREGEFDRKLRWGQATLE